MRRLKPMRQSVSDKTPELCSSTYSMPRVRVCLHCKAELFMHSQQKQY